MFVYYSVLFFIIMYTSAPAAFIFRTNWQVGKSCTVTDPIANTLFRFPFVFFLAAQVLVKKKRGRERDSGRESFLYLLNR